MVILGRKALVNVVNKSQSLHFQGRKMKGKWILRRNTNVASLDVILADSSPQGPYLHDVCSALGEGNQLQTIIVIGCVGVQ